MKYTNKNNIDEIFVMALENDRYDPGDSDVTTTQLVDPVQLTTLRKRYDSELTEEASDSLHRLDGSSLHEILRQAAPKDSIVEKRFYAEMGGWKIGGQVDRIKGRKLIDYKKTSVWSYIFGDKKDYEAQGNINRWILSKNGIEITELENVLYFRDWMKSKVGSKNYPNVQTVNIPLNLWPLEVAEQFIMRKVKDLQVAKWKDDYTLSTDFSCLTSDRWWNERKGIFARCEKVGGYCPVRHLCQQNA